MSEDLAWLYRQVRDELLAEDIPEGDHLIVHTGNGAQADDELLEQPPQDPDWSPDARG